LLFLQIILTNVHVGYMNANKASSVVTVKEP